jgi:TM2 domain-containing membrane protein YozV
MGYFLANNADELKAMSIVFIAACLNQWMLVRGVHEVVVKASGSNTTSKINVNFLFIGKVLVLIFALIFSVQIMGKRIIISVLIYVLQIVVLYFSIKKPKAEEGL